MISTSRVTWIVLTVAVSIYPWTSVAAQTVIYVDNSATGPTHDGSSWCSAYLYLQDALAVAQQGDEIRVADGTYKPDEGAAQAPGDRMASFELVNGVGLYGGFAGCGAVDPDARDVDLHETILSGDLNNDDHTGVTGSNCCVEHPSPGCDDPVCEAEVCSSGGTTEDCCTEEWDAFCAVVAGSVCTGLCGGEYSDNSNNIIVSFENDSSTILDGVTVTRGHATELPGTYGGGGGMWNIAGSPRVRNCTFVANVGRCFGLAMLNEASSPTVHGCRFIFNRTTGLGGGGLGMANINNSNPVVRGCVFTDNQGGAAGGGGVYIAQGSVAVLVNCLFARNSVGISGGAVLIEPPGGGAVIINCRFAGNSANTGGAIRYTGATEFTLVNCTFTGNVAGYGGALHYDGRMSSIVNSTLSRNSASLFGGGIYAYGPSSEVSLANCILWENSLGSVFQASGAEVTVNHSCIQGGWAGLGGVGIISDDPMFVDPDGEDNVVGTEDDDLRLILGSPCIDAADNEALPPDEFDLDNDGDTGEPIPIDLAGGMRFLDEPTAPDTGNGTPPIVDMGAYEFLIDCNANGIPDEFEPDTDGDGVIDACDGCPLDPQKPHPGVCGCGQPETGDSDGDGVLDCIDQCPGVHDAILAPGCHGAIPTVSAWGLIVLTLLLLTAGKIWFTQRRFADRA